ncbi:MAG: tetratricopeptide repeat protein, partial [Armatimonadetes bacterium]|nr:tetratricopeptide repeat protein [Armatimonadota bacterium]
MWPFRRDRKPSRRRVLAQAQALARRGDIDGATRLLEDFCREHPDDYAAVVNLGAAYYGAGKYTPAIEQF